MTNNDPQKSQILQTLRGTIETLEALVVRLETQTLASLPEETIAAWQAWAAQVPEMAIAAPPPNAIDTTSNEEWDIAPEPPTPAPRTDTPPSKPRSGFPIPLLAGIAAAIVTALLLVPRFLPAGEPGTVAQTPVPAIETPGEFTPPSFPNPLPNADEIPPPQSAPDLTPEERFLSALQAQVANITEQYAGNPLIASIQPNFAASLLRIQVADDWYEIESDRQDRLARELLYKSQSLDFSKLELTDLAGKLVARSPVVGPDMIILRR
jgi:hypothetical protein